MNANEHPDGRFGIVFQHLHHALEELDDGIGVNPSPGASAGGALSVEELEEMKELRDLIDDLTDPAPTLFTTD